MLYEVKLTKTARKIYLKLPPKLRIGLDNCFAKLEEEPRCHPNIKKLKGLISDYRYQVGGWRVMYEIDDRNRLVTVYDILPRGDAYKHGH
ncbi:MAG: type II toxin-antitoxin system RelE/ParE family toxin [Deltaproteobacteria bacterium]|nr:MAG: type II toxin-antitoxin system RelE/ParE family toxin [Deltaproteobacteria bacterium]